MGEQTQDNQQIQSLKSEIAFLKQQMDQVDAELERLYKEAKEIRKSLTHLWHCRDQLRKALSQLNVGVEPMYRFCSPIEYMTGILKECGEEHGPTETSAEKAAFIVRCHTIVESMSEKYEELEKKRNLNESEQQQKLQTQLEELNSNIALKEKQLKQLEQSQKEQKEKEEKQKQEECQQKQKQEEENKQKKTRARQETVREELLKIYDCIQQDLQKRQFGYLSNYALIASGVTASIGRPYESDMKSMENIGRFMIFLLDIIRELE